MDSGARSLSARWFQALLIPAALVAPAFLRAEDDDDDGYPGEEAERYASIRTLEGEATLWKGGEEEALDRGAPVEEGDVVESHGRGVLQLADGSRVAFGPRTRFEVAGLDGRIHLRLDSGRLRVAVDRDGSEVRIDSPSGDLLLVPGSDASLEVEGDRATRLKVKAGRVTFRNARGRTSLAAGERLTVYGPRDRLDRVQDSGSFSGDAFDSWSDRQFGVRRGPSWERVPPELRSYADDLDEGGEWIYVDERAAWCWRPLRVAVEWRPYWRGHWAAYPDGMTWISDEPWGYVTHHHGRWGWRMGLGWYWIPGAVYAPAWVAWRSDDVYFGWAPLGYDDRPVVWGYGSWRDGACWNIVEFHFLSSPRIHQHVRDEPTVIRHFNSGTGGTSWHHGAAGNRPLAPAWRKAPPILTPAELRTPALAQRALRNPTPVRFRTETPSDTTPSPAAGRPLRPHTAGGPERPGIVVQPGVRPPAAGRPIAGRPIAGPTDAGRPQAGLPRPVSAGPGRVQQAPSASAAPWPPPVRRPLRRP